MPRPPITVVDEDGAAVDLGTAVDYTATLQKPNGDEVAISMADFTVVDAATGRIDYLTVAGDLDQAGVYRLECWVQLAGGQWSSDIDSFRVHPVL